MVIAVALVEARKPSAGGRGRQPAEAHVTALGETPPVRIASDFESPPYVYSVDVRAHSAPCRNRAEPALYETSMKQDRRERKWTTLAYLPMSPMGPLDSSGLR